MIPDSVRPYVYYEEPDIVLLHGDCLEILPLLEPNSVDLVLTDPPYGMDWNAKVTRGKSDKRAKRKTEKYGNTITGDKETPDLSLIIGFGDCIIFGANHYPDQLKKGTFLVWIKRYDNGFGSFLSDAEVAWMSKGHGVYCHRDLTLQGESSGRAHPTQKPIGIIKWCIKKSGEPQLILDPFLGSGTTAVAAKQLGRKCIGIEIESKYLDIAIERLRQEVLF